ncbi:MAG: M48 family metallopeptidase [bacterium]|nr:M48 family metallopeptidase [bacterium]
MRRLARCAMLPALVWALTAAAPAPLPPYTPAYEPSGVDERGMWMQADEAERQMRYSPFVLRDPALNAYVRGILCRTVGEDRCRSTRLYIQRLPHFNATMYPNGMMTLWSGLLLRVRDEAELGAVLGHEFGHFERRHLLEGFKRARGMGDLLTWTALLSPTIYSSMATSMVGSYYAFSRAQETEADLLGVTYLTQSPYPAASAANVWDRIMAEADAAAAGRKRKANTHRYTAGFFASHPTDLARATYLREAAAKANDPGESGAAAYRAALAPFVGDFLADQIKLNDFGGTDYLLGQLAADGWTPDLLYARAELYRQRGNPRDLVSAATFYQQAIDGGFGGAEAQRGLGLSLLRSQQVDAGKAALRRYLHDKPDAQDAAVIGALVAQ